MRDLLVALQLKMGSCDQEGEEFIFECPRCSTGKKKLGVNLKRMLFNCFKCHWGGRVRDLLDYLGIEISDILPSKVSAQKEEVVPTPGEIPGFRPVGTDPEADIERAIVELCGRRGRLAEGQIRSRGWGWSEEKHLFGRLVMPVKVHGQLVQYLARAVYDFVEPKEKCGPTGLGWWPKTDVVYGFDALKNPSTLTFVEGIWDYEAVLRAGIWHGPLSLMGTQIGDVALGTVLSLRPKRIILLFDGDEAGERATVTIAERVRKRHFTDIFVARPPAGKDPDDLKAVALHQLLEKPVPYFSWLLTKPGLASPSRSRGR